MLYDFNIVTKNCDIVFSEVTKRDDKYIYVESIVFDEVKQNYKKIYENIDIKQNGNRFTVCRVEKIYRYKKQFLNDYDLFKAVCENLDTDYLDENCSNLFKNLKYALLVLEEKIIAVNFDEELLHKTYVCKIDNNYYKLRTVSHKTSEIVENISKVVPIKSYTFEEK